jgi:large subunit ribosomal protein L20
MPRVRKGAARTQARKRILRRARGYYGTKHRHKYQAENALIRAGVYAFRDRRQRKRDYRGLWIIRITAACKMRGTRYSLFMNGLKMAGIVLPQDAQPGRHRRSQALRHPRRNREEGLEGFTRQGGVIANASVH